MADLAQTTDLPCGQRFDFWRHVLSETFVPLEVSSPRAGDGFRGRLRGADLGTLRLCEVDAEAHVARRTRRLIAASAAGCYKVGLQLRGSSVLAQDGRQTPLGAGDFAIYDTDRPYTLAFDDPHRMLVLVFPRMMLGLPAERVARLTATRMSGREGLGVLIAPVSRTGRPGAGRCRRAGRRAPGRQRARPAYHRPGGAA